jgi:hypothetical protein
VFTWLVTSTVVVLAIAAVVAIAIREPDQPATLRPRPRRAREPRRRRTPEVLPAAGPLAPATTAATTAPAPAAGPAAVQEPADRPVGTLTEEWGAGAATVSWWVRLRSGVVLTVLLAFLGTLIAVSIAGIVLLLALAIRNAVT